MSKRVTTEDFIVKVSEDSADDPDIIISGPKKLMFSILRSETLEQDILLHADQGSIQLDIMKTQDDLTFKGYLVILKELCSGIKEQSGTLKSKFCMV